VAGNPEALVWTEASRSATGSFGPSSLTITPTSPIA
jgi:hypothetical protein